MTSTYLCPVCGFDDLPSPPLDADGDGSFEICPSCGFQFGVTDDDKGYTFETWRQRWVELGMPWWAAPVEAAPEGWNPEQQLAKLLAGGS
jgi:hypothetical protein